jgi:hypothetical protein
VAARGCGCGGAARGGGGAAGERGAREEASHGEGGRSGGRVEWENNRGKRDEILRDGGWVATGWRSGVGGGEGDEEEEELPSPRRERRGVW